MLTLMGRLDSLSQAGPSRPCEPAAASSASPDWLSSDIPALRRTYRELHPEGLQAGDRWQTLGRAPVLKALVHCPSRAAAPTAKILYFHGGGWYLGSPLTHGNITRALCRAAGLECWSLDYRLLPGPPGAAPLRDSVAAARALLCRYPGVRLALAGDSAGAAIALAVAQHLPPRALLGVVAFYGGYGFTDSPSITALGSRSEGLDAENLRAMYARFGAASDMPFTVPRLSQAQRAPVTFYVGDRDPLLSDSLALFAALQAKGRRVALRVIPGVGHSYLHEVTQGGAARRTIDDAAAVVAHWARQPG